MPRKFKLAIGLPSHNEETTIRTVTKDVDKALSKLGEKYECLIINSDNYSTDKTVELFASTSTHAKKISLSSRKPGKGSNMRKIIEYSLNLGCDGIVFMDTDLRSISPEWVQKLASHLYDGYDAVFSRRVPKWNGGDLTYHITYPAICRYWRANIHEPISGEFGFSKKVLQDVMEMDWDKTMYGYGIDILLTTVAAKYQWIEIILQGRKSHILRSYNTNDSNIITMNPKFLEVLNSTKVLVNNSQNITGNRTLTSRCIGSPDWEFETVPMSDPELEELNQTVRFNLSKYQTILNRLAIDVSEPLVESGVIGINQSKWFSILLRYFDSNDIELELVMETIFFARVIGFHRENRRDNKWYQNVETDAIKFSKS